MDRTLEQSPGGESGPGHADEQPWTNHFTTLSLRLPFVNRDEKCYGLESFCKLSNVKESAIVHSFTNMT